MCQFPIFMMVLAVFPALCQAGNPAGEDHSHHAHAMEKAHKSYSRVFADYVLPDAVLTDQDGKVSELSNALDHDGLVLVQFIFTTCPTICPVLSSAFASAQDGLRQYSARLISITIDPEHDTPARLKAYANQYKAGSQWSFLTGSREDIEAVQKAFDIYRGNKMRHEPTTYLFRGGNRWLRFDGFMSAEQLIAECEQAGKP